MLRIESKRVKQARDGILRERREHARGRILMDCGRICGSPGKSMASNKRCGRNISNDQ